MTRLMSMKVDFFEGSDETWEKRIHKILPSVCVCVRLQTYSESAGISLISDLND